MADEPVLCFDGDSAGVRAAYRAVDLAMPRLKPGKSLKFALLPQGQDPDDLVRSGGREAVADVIAAARPLAAMLWARETEGHSFDTPERRAALEARINEVTTGDRRRRRAQILPAGFQRAAVAVLCARAAAAARTRASATGASRVRTETGATAAMATGSARSRREPAGRATPYVVVSQQMASSPVHRGHRTAVPRREALILQAALNYPWLLHDHLEDLASLEFRHADAERLKSALIDIAAHNAGHAATLDPRRSRLNSPARNLGEVVGAHRAVDHHLLGLGRAARGRAGRCFGDLGAACRLASAVAFTN